MENITIWVTKKQNGYNFSISHTVRLHITTIFPNAHPIKHFFVSYKTDENTRFHYLKLLDNIIPSLFGLENRTQINTFGPIQFVEPETGVVIQLFSPLKLLCLM